MIDRLSGSVLRDLRFALAIVALATVGSGQAFAAAETSSGVQLTASEASRSASRDGVDLNVIDLSVRHCWPDGSC